MTQTSAEALRALDGQATMSDTVRVHVDGGIATLTGTVRSILECAKAEEVVREVRGIQQVVNDIAIANRTSPERFEPPDSSS